SFNLQSLSLTEANANDNLVIYYNHCGVPGKGRAIEIQDASGTVLKKYNFGDGANLKDGMTIPVKELLALEKKHKGMELAIHYSAQDMPKGFTLTDVKFTGKA